MDDVYYGNDYLEDAYEEDDGYYWLGKNSEQNYLMI